MTIINKSEITWNDFEKIEMRVGTILIVNDFEGAKVSGIKPKSELIKTAFMYLNAQYLWGGKSPFGIDCSGFTQMVYKLNGYKLLRDASQQSKQGDALSFIE
jgi:hypothetical protein